MTDETSQRFSPGPLSPGPLSPDPLSRRAFLRGGVCLAGSVLIGLTAIPKGQAFATPAKPALALAYWDEVRLVDASHLPNGDPSLCATGLRVTVQSHTGSVRTLSGLSALYRIETLEQEQFVPYHAWTASAHGSKTSVFSIPVFPAHGLAFLVRHAAPEDSSCAETLCRLCVGADAGRPKLRAGTYVLATPGTDWSAYELTEGQHLTTRDGHQAVFDHLIVTVRAA